MQVKSEGYRRTRSTRSYLCAASGDECGGQALDWVMESLVQGGDELIVFRGFDGEGLGALVHLRSTYDKPFFFFIRSR